MTEENESKLAEEDKLKFVKIVENIVMNKSGGMKLTELVTEFAEIVYNSLDDGTPEDMRIFKEIDFIGIPDFLDEIIKMSKKLKTLDYFYPNANRIKTFIYYPLE